MDTSAVVFFALLVATTSAASFQKRSRACEDLSDSIIDFLQVATSLSPELEQMITLAEPAVLHEIHVNHNTHRATLAAEICKLEDAGSIAELAQILDTSEVILQYQLLSAAEQWRLIGGADGLRRLSEPLLRGFDAFERMGLLDLAENYLE